MYVRWIICSEERAEQLLLFSGWTLFTAYLAKRMRMLHFVLMSPSQWVHIKNWVWGKRAESRMDTQSTRYIMYLLYRNTSKCCMFERISSTRIDRRRKKTFKRMIELKVQAVGSYLYFFLCRVKLFLTQRRKKPDARRTPYAPFQWWHLCARTDGWMGRWTCDGCTKRIQNMLNFFLQFFCVYVSVATWMVPRKSNTTQ